MLVKTNIKRGRVEVSSKALKDNPRLNRPIDESVWDRINENLEEIDSSTTVRFASSYNDVQY